jgi:hypothetical protein
MIYSVHFDASGSEKLPVITVAGGISSIARWVRFEREWTKILTEDGLPPGTIFRMALFASCEGPFSIYKGKSAKKATLFAELVSCIVRHVSKMFSIAVVIADYEAFDADWCFREQFGSAYSFAGLMCIKNSLDWVQKVKTKRNPELQIFFEKGDEHQGELDSLCQSHFSLEIDFRNKDMIQFQPGDMIAWKNRTAVTNARIQGPTQDPEILDSILRSVEELKRIHSMNGVYDREALDRYASGGTIPKRI